MKKVKVSPLANFLFKEIHPEINSTLFKNQVAFTAYAVETVGTKFYGKAPDGLRPLVNQQLKQRGEPNNKPVVNHYETYRKTILRKIKSLNEQLDIHLSASLLEKFDTVFKEQNEPNPRDVIIFEHISVGMLEQLTVVAKAAGGQLSYDNFCISLKNLSEFE